MRGTLLAVMAVAFLLPATAAYAETLRIYHIDVDQGDATLFVAPNGRMDFTLK